MTTLYYILGIMGMGLRLNLEKDAKGGGGATPPSGYIWTQPWLGF